MTNARKGCSVKRHILCTEGTERIEIAPGIDAEHVEVWIYGRYGAAISVMGFRRQEIVDFLRQVLEALERKHELVPDQ